MDQARIRLLGSAVRGVGIKAEIGIAVEGLGVVFRPGVDLVGVHPDCAILKPGIELRQLLVIGILRHARVETVIPVVHAADQVATTHETVGHQRAAVQAAAIKNRYVLVEAHNHQIDFANERILRRAIWKIGESGDRNLVHGAVPFNVEQV